MSTHHHHNNNNHYHRGGGGIGGTGSAISGGGGGGGDQYDREVAVFWDYENVPIPSWCSASAAAKAIVQQVSSYGRITDRRLYFDFSRSIRDSASLDSSGFDLVNTPTRNNKETLDKKLIADVLTFAWDSAVRSKVRPCIVLLTSDGDYAYTLSKLRDRGVMTVVMLGSDPSISDLLRQTADESFSLEHDVLHNLKPTAAVAATTTTTTTSASSSYRLDDGFGMSTPSTRQNSSGVFSSTSTNATRTPPRHVATTTPSPLERRPARQTLDQNFLSNKSSSSSSSSLSLSSPSENTNKEYFVQDLAVELIKIVYQQAKHSNDWCPYSHVAKALQDHIIRWQQEQQEEEEDTKKPMDVKELSKHVRKLAETKRYIETTTQINSNKLSKHMFIRVSPTGFKLIGKDDGDASSSSSSRKNNSNNSTNSSRTTILFLRGTMDPSVTALDLVQYLDSCCQEEMGDTTSTSAGIRRLKVERFGAYVELEWAQASILMKRANKQSGGRGLTFGGATLGAVKNTRTQNNPLAPGTSGNSAPHTTTNYYENLTTTTTTTLTKGGGSNKKISRGKQPPPPSGSDSALPPSRNMLIYFLSQLAWGTTNKNTVTSSSHHDMDNNHHHHHHHSSNGWVASSRIGLSFRRQFPDVTVSRQVLGQPHATTDFRQVRDFALQHELVEIGRRRRRTIMNDDNNNDDEQEDTTNMSSSSSSSFVSFGSNASALNRAFQNDKKTASLSQEPFYRLTPKAKTFLLKYNNNNNNNNNSKVSTSLARNDDDGVEAKQPSTITLENDDDDDDGTKASRRSTEMFTTAVSSSSGNSSGGSNLHPGTKSPKSSTTTTTSNSHPNNKFLFINNFPLDTEANDVVQYLESLSFIIAPSNSSNSSKQQPPYSRRGKKNTPKIVVESLWLEPKNWKGSDCMAAHVELETVAMGKALLLDILPNIHYKGRFVFSVTDRDVKNNNNNNNNSDTRLFYTRHHRPSVIHKREEDYNGAASSSSSSLLTTTTASINGSSNSPTSASTTTAPTATWTAALGGGTTTTTPTSNLLSSSGQGSRSSSSSSSNMGLTTATTTTNTPDLIPDLLGLGTIDPNFCGTTRTTRTRVPNASSIIINDMDQHDELNTSTATTMIPFPSEEQAGTRSTTTTTTSSSNCWDDTIAPSPLPSSSVASSSFEDLLWD